MEHFKPEDNPLRNVKVETEVDFDSARLVYRLLHGPDSGYRKERQKLQSVEHRNKEERKLNF